MNIRTQEMMRLRSEGYTLQEIAYLYQISRERVRQVIGNTKRKEVMSADEDGYRKCYRCKEVLPEEDFYTEKCNVCMECTRAKQKEILKANPQWQKKGGKYYDRQKCRRRTQYLLKIGKLHKSECKMKSDECFGRIEAHHYMGYDHPELVEWYCQKHHRQIEGAMPFGRTP